MQENIHRNFGMPQPNGYRKALRFMKHADHFGFPIVTFVDTPGAFAGKQAEEAGQVCSEFGLGLWQSRHLFLHITHQYARVVQSMWGFLTSACSSCRFCCYKPALEWLASCDFHELEAPCSIEAILLQGEAIAVNLREMFGFRVPIISVVIGEGGSGGALAIGCSNYTFIMEHSVYYVASPEACAAILWKSREKSKIVSEAACMFVGHIACTASLIYAHRTGRMLASRPQWGGRGAHASFHPSVRC